MTAEQASSEIVEAITTPEQYVEFFNARKISPPGGVKGLCGRFVRGIQPSDFEKLSDEPGKRLSWVCGEDLLQSLLGKSPVEAMVSIGFTLQWLEGRLKDGTEHKLVVFPSDDTHVATWDNVMVLVSEEFGEEVHQRLMPHLPDMKALPIGTKFAEVDPSGRLFWIGTMPVAEKYAQPDYMTVERFLALDGPVSLLQARAFMDNSVGCNHFFTGTGLSPTGKPELLTRNRRIEEIPGAVQLPLAVTEAEVYALKEEAASEP